MANSSMARRIAKWRKWKSENPDFPLTVGANGQWCKTVLHRVRYFGPLDCKKAAEDLWNLQKDDLLAGREPKRSTNEITVGDLAEKFTADANARRDRGELSGTNARDLVYAATFAVTHLGKARPVSLVTAEDFAGLREAIAVDTDRNLRSQANLILQIRSMFRWGGDGDTGMGLFKSVRFGPRFRPPSADALRKEKENSGKERFIEPADIRKLIDAAKPGMKCMLLLGVNCGFYAIDSIRLTFSRLHLDNDPPYHDFPRVKNGRPRKSVLWPETVGALRDYIANHRGDDPSDYVILNQYGRPYTERASGRGIRTTFTALLTSTGVTVSPGTSIGSLRHVYGTVMDLSSDQQMIDLTMGHAPKAVQKRIYSQRHLSELERLAELAQIVRGWLYDDDGDDEADTIPFPATG